MEQLHFITKLLDIKDPNIQILDIINKDTHKEIIAKLDYDAEQGKEVYFIRKTKALVLKAFDGDIYLNIADKIYHTKELLDHELYSKNFEQEPEQKKERRKYIPPQTHPWKLTSFKQYLHKNKKDYEEFTSEELHSPQLQV
ncbi:transposase [Streptococcus pneumoniae]|nr:transposase [Streptococcus pneumoniae]